MADQEQREFVKARKIIWGEILDFDHFEPALVATCIKDLAKMFGNVAEHPEDTHFRKVRAANPAFEQHVAAVTGAIELMVEVGWRVKVVDYERSWTYSYPTGSPEFNLMREVVHELHKAGETADAKAKKHKERLRDPHAEQRAQREAVLRQIEADRRDRHDHFVYTH